MGIASITSNAEDLPKLRVTCLICTDELPQWAHCCLEDIDCNDDKFPGEADFNDGLRVTAVERTTGNDVFDFMGLDVALTLCDLAREDDVFEIKD